MKEKLTKELEKVKGAEQSQYSEVDEQTMSELAELGLLDDGTAHIEATRCNWEEEKPKKRTANLSKTYAAQTPTGNVVTKQNGEKPKSKGRDER